MECNCDYICWNLEISSKEILDKGDQNLQWKMFEQFLRKYVESISEPCPKYICSVLIHKLAEFRGRAMSLSTLLVDLITILYFKQCARRCVYLAWNFKTNTSFSRDRESLRGLLALQTSNKEFMELLLEFGLLSRLSDSSYLVKALKFKLEIFIIMLLDPDIVSELNDATFHAPHDEDDALDEDDTHEEDDTHDDIHNKGAYYIRKEVMKLVKGIFLCHTGEENYKRMFLVIIAVHAIHLNLVTDHSLAEQIINCLRIYFTGTQDPFISVFEVRSILYACFLLIKKLVLFDIYYREFDKLMPEYPAKMEPRKLTHLTRHQIRQSLKVSHLPLTASIDRLHLPKSLKRFLLGEVLEISNTKGNVSSQKCVTLSELEILLSKQPDL